MDNKIIAVDFDGTLCENAYPEIGEPNEELIKALKYEQIIGTKLILWTNRCGEYLDAAIEWCHDHGLIFDAVNENLPEMIEFFGNDCRKVFANEYIDDRAVPVKSGSSPMTGYTYQIQAMRTSRWDKFNKPDLLLNAALGLCGEAGEFADIIKKYQFQGHPLDEAHAIKELGDIAWYLALAADTLGVTLDYVFEQNIEKLRKRYPNGFAAENSITRAENDM